MDNNEEDNQNQMLEEGNPNEQQEEMDGQEQQYQDGEQYDGSPGDDMNGEEQQFQDEGQYEDIDLTPYEEDDDATLHQKLVAAKLARKRAEDDLRLLTNRIQLLKQEENRAFKKIEQTRKKAGDIVYQRRRNMEHQSEKQLRNQMKMNEEAQITLLHKAQKEEQRQKILYNKRAHGEKIKQDVNYAKEEKAQQKELFYHQSNQHVAKATMIKNLIRDQQQEAKQKKQKELFEKKMKARQQMHEKMAREEQERLNHENAVQQMEMEELELIKRLKDTQMMQQQAFKQLEDALQTNPTGGSQNQSSTVGSKNGFRKGK